jgi:hypothetical protein
MSKNPQTQAALYLPQAGSLAALVVAYFGRLRDEELSAPDIALKWSTDPHNLAHRLQGAVDAGLLARDGSVYSAGPQIARIDLSPGALLKAAAAPLRRHSNVAPPINMDTLVFEEGYSPVSAKVAGVRRSDLWAEKLATMQPGQSFVVNVEHRNTISPAMTELAKQGRGKFAMRSVDTDNVRVFCVSLGGGAA